MKYIKLALVGIIGSISLGAQCAIVDYLYEHVPYNPPMTVFYCVTGICIGLCACFACVGVLVMEIDK